MEPNQVQPGVMGVIAPTKVSSHRTFVFSLIIVAVAIIAGIVLLSANRDLMPSPDSAPYQTAETQSLGTTTHSNSTDLNDIDADLQATVVE